MLARRFLYLVAALIVLVLAVGIGWSLFQDRLLRAYFVPPAPFTAMPDATAPDYAKPASWVARPDLPDDPARWLPPGVARATGPAAIFYIAPTTFLDRTRWNAPLDDGQANYRLDLFTRNQASAFNGAGAIWAPRYRQATFGAFLAAADPRSTQALSFAYRDVARAFDAFVAAQLPGRPLILAGHSQGSYHLLRLLRERIAGTPLARRIVAVYAIGWPVSLTADLPALGLPACAAPDSTRCLVTWQSFAAPAEPKLQDAYFDATRGYAGPSRRGTAMLCTNPLTGAPGGTAPAAANLGSLVPNVTLTEATLAPGLIPAACDPRGLLVIGAPPKGFGTYVLPGNNYHVFDYALFWANLRTDAARRLAAFR